MTKKVLIIIVALVIVGCLIGGYFLFLHNGNSNQSINEKNDSWLRVASVSELEAMAKKNNKTLEINEGDYYVLDLPIGSRSTTYGYSTDSNGSVTGLNMGVALVSSTEASGRYSMEKITPQELRDRITDVFGWISETLNVNIGTNYYILGEESALLSVGDDLSYKKILNGEASLDLRILDTDSSVWVLEVFRVHGFNIISCTFTHYSADSEEAQQPCYVTVNQ